MSTANDRPTSTSSEQGPDFINEDEPAAPGLAPLITDNGFLISDNTQSPDGLLRIDSEPTHDQKVQKQLAIWIIGCILFVYLIIIVFYVFDIRGSSTRLGESLTYAISGLQTLAAAVVGFYYGSKQN